MRNTCENITFPQLPYEVVTINYKGGFIKDIGYPTQSNTYDNLYFKNKIRLLINNYFTKYYHITAEAIQNCHGHIVLEFILGYLTVSNVKLVPTQKKEMLFVVLNSIGELIVNYNG